MTNEKTISKDQITNEIQTTKCKFKNNSFKKNDSEANKL